MVTQQALAALDEAHRVRQLSNAEQVARLVLAYWLLVDPQDVKGTGLAWLDRSTLAIVAGRQRSADIAAAYALGVRRLHFPAEAPPELPPVPDPPLVAIRRSLAYTGLGNAALKVDAVKRVASRSGDRVTAPADVSRAITDIYRRQREIERGLATAPREERALDRAITQIMSETASAPAAAAVRHVQNGGRERIMNIVESDRLAVGYVRITRDDPCYFCAALASRGPVYGSESFDRSDPRFEGEGTVKVHDSCGCATRPVYSQFRSEWPEASIGFEAEWDEMRKGKHADLELMEAWRRKREGRPWRHNDPAVVTRAA